VAVSQNGKLLQTEVTIGYDTPWQKVHSMLLEAAGRTEGIQRSPEPHVLQTALSDFYVHYQLRFHCADLATTIKTQAELHQHIQDVFAEQGEQIMSPHYRAMQGDEPLLPPQPTVPV
jgi:small-conductance mechanosensitive channel